MGRLEETPKLLNLWFNTNEPIDYDGKFWKVKQGGISLPAYTEGGPKLLVAGGPTWTKAKCGEPRHCDRNNCSPT